MSTWSLKAPEGKATVVDGDIYFSPNSQRHLPAILSPSQRWQFVERVSVASEFQEPRWWTEGTEWLGFVPRQPVPYTGVWFGPLAIIPNKLLCKNNVDYGLPPFYSDKWLEIDFMLWETCEILRNEYDLKYALPFPPRRWGYHKMFSSRTLAMDHITKSRDWFALWIGLLYWSTRKVPNGPDFAEGLTPPEWFRKVILKRSNNIYVDAIRTSQLLQNWWQVDRVGVLLHHPGDTARQPAAQWFVTHNIPVWYRWGERERRSSRFQDFSLITPSPEHLQNATTWIAPSPSTYASYAAQISGIGSYDDTMPPPEPSYDFTPMSPESPFVQNSPSIVSTSPQPCGRPSASSEPLAETSRPKEQVQFNKHGDPVWEYGSGKSVWEPFFKKQEERHKRKMEKETPKMTQARLSRMRQPPTTSCPVYVWDWNDDDPRQFVRALVRKDERFETLGQYSEKQKRYNAFDNEWDCCRDWGDDLDEDDLILDDSQPLPDHLVTHKTDEELKTEGLAKEAGRLLYEYYGWVIPIPLPYSNVSMSDQDRKSFIAVLGLQSASSPSIFFDTDLPKAAMGFVRLLAAKETARPSPHEWDLAQESRLTLAYSDSLNSIRTIKRGSEVWYMFDFGRSKTVPWNLVVPTATTALMVCRLKEKLDGITRDKLDESAVARELVLEGVRFHTVVRRDLLGPADPEYPTSTYIPMRLSDHVFVQQDYDFFRRQCREILTSPRARAALMRGGFIRRLALEFMGLSEALRGPCAIYENPDHMFIAQDVHGVEYVDDDFSDDEYNMLCGMYYKFTGEGQNLVKVSWYPQTWVYENSGLDLGRWSEHAESFWIKRSGAILNNNVNSNLAIPLNVSEWRSKLRGLADARKAGAKVEKWSKEYLRGHIGNI